MNYKEMVRFIKKNPGVKVTHRLFASDEYVYSDGNKVFDEKQHLFEDWDSPLFCGLRMRSQGAWAIGWSVYETTNRQNYYRHYYYCK